jgi:pyruvate kinase
MTCTLGPSSKDQSVIQQLSDSGMSIARLNFSHVPAGEYTYPESIIDQVRKCGGMHTKVLGRNYNLLSVMLDTKGPEIRTGIVTGYVPGDENLYVDFKDDAEVIVTTHLGMKEQVSESHIYIDYDAIGSTVGPGHVLLLDDGLIGLEVVEVRDKLVDDEGKEYCEVLCKVSNGGQLGSVKGVNIPNAGRRARRAKILSYFLSLSLSLSN